MYIKDLETGAVRIYGTNHHDSLVISDDGRSLFYYNLQCGRGSKYGGFQFVTDDDGKIPSEDEALMMHGADAYFNIGGFDKECEEKDGDSVLGRLTNHDIMEAFGISSLEPEVMLDTDEKILDEIKKWCLHKSALEKY